MFTLDRALSAISDKPEFSVKDRGSYTVIDYNLNNRETFVGKDFDETNILLNLRGTAFDKNTGLIVSLPLHKFFNIGEFPEKDSQIDLSCNHTITKKLDGSMIRVIKTSTGYDLGTRAGKTDVSLLAENYINDLPHKNYQKFIHFCIDKNITPIFEFCSRANRVVIDFPIPELTLLSMRYMSDGKYYSYEEMVIVAKQYDVPFVISYPSTNNNRFKEFLSEISELENDEGVVIHIESGTMTGHMVKQKSKDYVLKHKAMDGLRFEKDVLLMSLNGLLDDVYPLLDDVTHDRVQTHVDAFTLRVLETSAAIVTEFLKYEHLVVRSNILIICFIEKIKNILISNQIPCYNSLSTRR